MRNLFVTLSSPCNDPKGSLLMYNFIVPAIIFLISLLTLTFKIFLFDEYLSTRINACYLIQPNYKKRTIISNVQFVLQNFTYWMVIISLRAYRLPWSQLIKAFTLLYLSVALLSEMKTL